MKPPFSNSYGIECTGPKRGGYIITSLRRTLETSASESLYGGQFTLSTQLITPNDEGLTLETSSSESLYDGQFTLSTQLIKPNYLVILPPTQHHSFFRNLPPLSYTIIRQLHGRANIYFLLTISLVIFFWKFNLRIKCLGFFFERQKSRFHFLRSFESSPRSFS